MSIWSSIGKTMKEALNLTAVGMEELSKGIKNTSSYLEERNKVQRATMDARVTYQVELSLLESLESIADAQCRTYHWLGDSKERLNAYKEAEKILNKNNDNKTDYTLIITENNPWPLMAKPLTDDATIIDQVNELYESYLKILEEAYARLYKRCINDQVFEKYFRDLLIKNKCPYDKFIKLCPNAKSSPL